jgi:hypothetical protein
MPPAPQLQAIGAALAAALRDTGAIAVDIHTLPDGGLRITPVDTTYLGPHDVAGIIGISPETVCKWADRGRLSHIRGPGRRGIYRFELTQLRRDLKKITRNARSAAS